MERVNVAAELRAHVRRLPGVDLDNLTFFVGRSLFVPGSHPMNPPWRKKLFLWLANNVEEAFDYFAHAVRAARADRLADRG